MDVAVRPACAGLGPDLFFSFDDADRDQAKAVCRRCPLQPSCLLSAMARRERFGIWGGVCFEAADKSAGARRKVEREAAAELARLEPASA